LHVIDPSGEEIWFEHKASKSGGILDVDMNNFFGGDTGDKTGDDEKKGSLQPVENIYWSSGQAPSGRYRVFVKYFMNYKFDDDYKDMAIQNCDDPTEYTVRVKVNDKFKDFKGKTTYVKDLPSEQIFEFDYYTPKAVLVELTEANRSQFEEFVKSSAPAELGWVGIQRLFAPYFLKKDWDNVYGTLLKFKEIYKSSESVSKRIEKTIALIQRPDRNLKIENLGDAINTTGEEYSPVISGDDRMLYFCGRNRTDSKGKEDIFYSELKFNDPVINGKDTLRDTIGIWQPSKLFEYLIQQMRMRPRYPFRLTEIPC
jgi:hypothetical protein